ncbi:MAG: NAD(P)-dependent oxidoreductase [Pseudomonadota bacterium]
MRYFPLFFDLSGRTVLLAGGGEQMAQKARLVLRTDAQVTVMAPSLIEELAAHVAAGRMTHLPAVWDEEAVASADLVFAATGCVGIDAMIAARATAPVNVVDRPALCDVITPAIVDRDPLVIAIGTEGAAPVMGRQLRSRLETMLEPELGGFVALTGRLRGHVADNVPVRARRRFWEGVFSGPARRLWQDGKHAEAEEVIRKAALQTVANPGRVTVIALPEAVDLLPIRALQRLQAADLVLGGPAAQEAVDLARRDAERAALPDRPEGLVAALQAAAAAGLATVVLLDAEDAGRFAPALVSLAGETIGRLAEPPSQANDPAGLSIAEVASLSIPARGQPSLPVVPAAFAPSCSAPRSQSAASAVA